jgi:hypothetical protein
MARARWLQAPHRYPSWVKPRPEGTAPSSRGQIQRERGRWKACETLYTPVASVADASSVVGGAPVVAANPMYPQPCLAKRQLRLFKGLNDKATWHTTPLVDSMPARSYLPPELSGQL